MPTYLAVCSKCKVKEEYFTSMSKMDEDLPYCSSCKERMERGMIANVNGGPIFNVPGFPGNDMKKKALHKDYVTGKRDWRKP